MAYFKPHKRRAGEDSEGEEDELSSSSEESPSSPKRSLFCWGKSLPRRSTPTLTTNEGAFSGEKDATFVKPKEVPHLPPECLMSIFRFVRSYEAFPLAMVCWQWYNLLSDKQHKCGEHKWMTWIGCVVNTVPRLIWAHTRCALPWDTRVCAAAALCGNLETLQCARIYGYPWSTSTCTFAAAGGHLAVLQWARTNGCFWDEDTCSWAAKNGHLAVIQWARENGCEWAEDTCAKAAAGGHLAVLKWSRANGCPWYMDTCSSAAKNGHLAVLQWARTHGCAWNFVTCTEAAGSGHLEVLKWAIEHGCLCSAEASEQAARNGHIKVLEWLLAWDRTLWTPRVYVEAAARGHLDIVEMGLKHGFSMDSSVPFVAACNGRLHVLERVVDHLLQDSSAWKLDHRLCANASYGGHLHVLKWLRERGCPWDRRTIDHAKTEEMRRWAIENGCPTDFSTTDV